MEIYTETDNAGCFWGRTYLNERQRYKESFQVYPTGDFERFRCITFTYTQINKWENKNNCKSQQILSYQQEIINSTLKRKIKDIFGEFNMFYFARHMISSISN